MFPKNSAFKAVAPPIGSRPTGLPPRPPLKLEVGSTKKLGVVEIPVEQLENWYATLNDLHHTASDQGNDDLLEVRDQVYSYLRG